MPYSAKRLSLLIIDDGEPDRELYRRLLKKHSSVSFDITEVETVAAARKILKGGGHPFDCFIVDYLLPDSDGLTFAKEIMAHTGATTPAIIMVTGQGSEEIAVEALKIGITDYLTKANISSGVFVRPLLGAIEKARLRTELRNSRAALERSNNELFDFAHTASHDLKAPLRRISSYCDMLREDAATRLLPEDLRVLDRMTVNTQRMQALIDGLLAFSRVTTEKEELKSIDLKSVLDDVIEELKQDHTIDMHFDIAELPHVEGYPLKIRQVFANLLSNAVKYRSAQSLVVVIGAQHSRDETIFWVRDNGIGIAAEYHADVFKDFKRLHAQEDIEGTGLGLPICRKIVELHQGRIWVESAQGQGAAFFFTLPVKKAADANAA